MMDMKIFVDTGIHSLIFYRFICFGHTKINVGKKINSTISIYHLSAFSDVLLFIFLYIQMLMYALLEE